MTIAPAILENYTNLDDDQKKVIGHLKGPLLVVAGPGSGKTYSIVLRALNLLLLGLARPEQIVMCTFTEKAAFEMRDRLSAAAARVGYSGDLSQLRASTIHSLCNRVLTRHVNRTRLGHNYETLDELTQLLFMFDHFDEIFGPMMAGKFLGKWRTKWTAIEGAHKYFDKMTEELVDPSPVCSSSSSFLSSLGEAYRRYEAALWDNNRVDFAHLQSLTLRLFDSTEVGDAVIRDIAFVLVDEYQDTNYVQEQLLLRLSHGGKNLCVVGDEDQSLYRFRGATVRNILEFEDRVVDCEVVKLTTNYRSHRQIVRRYDRWMSSVDWSNPSGRPFRYQKTIEPYEGKDHPDYPSVFAIWGTSPRDEATRFAEMVAFLKSSGTIEDYSQVALLLHSVQPNHSGEYLAALQAKGIPVFCPRARGYFANDEVRFMVACFAVMLGWHTNKRGETGGSVAELARYVDQAIVDMVRKYAPPQPLASRLRDWATEIESLGLTQSLDMRPADYFYQLVALEPFKSAIRDQNKARNLAVFSQLLNAFQTYYHYTVITGRNRVGLRMHLFNSFIRLLFDGGINEYEDPDNPFPKGYVQVLTIHQAKGLEFPVVVVDSLATQLPTSKQVDHDLRPFLARPPFEPEGRITLFDRMRLHYVAFSRAEKLLVLTTSEPPKEHFGPIWDGLPQWPYVQTDVLTAQRFEARQRMPVKKTFSFTGDLRIYETCPRQYEFFREYDFTPSRSAVIFFGLLVHQTIEDIHREVMAGNFSELDEGHIQDLFDRNVRFLCLSDVRPIGETARKAAYRQVTDYFNQNSGEMARVIETEVDVSLEKETYILTGKVDLLMGGDGKLELLDFKTSPRPRENPWLLESYEQQLCTYAHVLEKRHNRHVDRLLLYWTSEANKKDALMVLPYDHSKVDAAGRHFDDIVRRIASRQFAPTSTPEPSICKECDLRDLCRSEGICVEATG